MRPVRRYDALAVRMVEPLTKPPSGLQRTADESYDHPFPTESVGMNLSAAQSVWTCLRYEINKALSCEPLRQQSVFDQ